MAEIERCKSELSKKSAEITSMAKNLEEAEVKIENRDERVRCLTEEIEMWCSTNLVCVGE